MVNCTTNNTHILFNRKVYDEASLAFQNFLLKKQLVVYNINFVALSWEKGEKILVFTRNKIITVRKTGFSA